MRVYSTLGNPNVLSEYLLLVIPMSCAFIITSRGALARLFFVGTTGVMLACMLLTFARGGWLGLVVAAAIFLTMLDRRFILLIFAGLAAAYFLLPDAYIDRFTSIGNLEDGSTSYRLQIWLATVTMLGDYWFTGIGPGEAAFNKVYPLYGYNTVTAPHSHNLFLQVICDAGFGAFVAFMAILLSVARTLGAAFARESDGRGRVYQAAAAASLAGFLVQGLTDYSFYNYRVALTFWICVGLAALTARRGKLPERGRVLL
jgi:putative inorganic carbon (HCO3(-)) transporter